MKIDREKLLTALRTAAPGLSKEENVEQATSYFIEEGWISTFNDEISISSPMDELDEKFSVIVPGRTFLDLVARSTDKELEITATKTLLQVKGKRSTAKFQIEKENLSPISTMDYPDITEATKLPKDFSQALKLCSLCVSRDLNRPALAAIFLSGDLMCASDGVRIIRFSFDGASDFNDVLFFGRNAGALATFNPVSMVEKESWLFFFDENEAVFSVRKVEGKYPDINQHIDFDGPTISLDEVRDDLLEAVSRAEVFAKASVDQARVHFSVDLERVLISGTGPTGTYEEQIKKIGYKGDSVAFEINPVIFSSALVHGGDLILEDAKQPKKAKVETDSFDFVVLCFATVEKKSEKKGPKK